MSGTPEGLQGRACLAVSRNAPRSATTAAWIDECVEGLQRFNNRCQEMKVGRWVKKRDEQAKEAPEEGDGAGAVVWREAWPRMDCCVQRLHAESGCSDGKRRTM